jgi:hypothetical protein
MEAARPVCGQQVLGWTDFRAHTEPAQLRMGRRLRGIRVLFPFTPKAYFVQRLGRVDQYHIGDDVTSEKTVSGLAKCRQG